MNHMNDLPITESSEWTPILSISKKLFKAINTFSTQSRLPDSSYDDLKATVIHSIDPLTGVNWTLSPFMSHGGCFKDAKDLIEKTYGYKHIYDNDE